MNFRVCALVYVCLGLTGVCAMEIENVGQAQEIAEQELRRWPHHQFVVDESRTQEYPFGWVFLYVPRQYLETNDPRYAVPGNGPIIITRTGQVDFLPTSMEEEDAVAEYYERWKKNQGD